MDMQVQVKEAKPIYRSIVGCDPNYRRDHSHEVVVTVVLPRLGEYDFKYVDARETVGRQYYHYASRIHRRAVPVNVHVYGDRKQIEEAAWNRSHVRCTLQLMEKQRGDRKFVIVNLFVLPPWEANKRSNTHEFRICPAPAKKRPEWVYTTADMNGTGVSVRPL
jgi:hypothetical protein